MQLINTINQHFESSCSVTPQYLSAKKNFKSLLVKMFGKDSVIIGSCPHFEFTGFIKKNGKFVYFSTGDLRWKICGSMLVRTAKHEKDYTGGYNNEVKYDENFDQNFQNKVNQLLA